MPREFYFNADFDLTLRGRPSLLDAGEKTFLHEMAVHFLFACGSDDGLILHRNLPADFLDYLRDKQIPCPRVVLHPGITPEAEFTPFGWNAHARSRNGLYDRPTPHPDLEAVRAVNSRAFSLDLEREWTAGNGGPQGPYPSWEALEAGMQTAPSVSGWMVKANHGHAGTGNRRIPPTGCGEEDRTVLQGYFADQGQVVLEPWHTRLLDMGMHFTLEPVGEVRNLRGHELLNSRDGAFMGVKILPSRQVPEPWREEMIETVYRLAPVLRGRGYFGPVSLDAYVWQAPEGPRLRPLVDINARLSMAWPAHAWAQRLPGKSLLWIWFSAAKITLPATYREWRERLGRLDFDPVRGAGILATSPFRWNAVPGAQASSPTRPKRVGFLLSAAEEGGLPALHRACLQALGKGG